MAIRLARRLGPADAALIVMGGIIGSGIFRNPSVVAKELHTTPLILIAWCIGGVFALLGAFLFAELAARRPADGGLYAYIRDAFHPVVAFAYGWTLLLVSQSGGMASAAVTLGAYVTPLSGLHLDERLVGAVLIVVLTAINCLGVRTGTTTQNVFMIAKIAALAGLVVVGLFAPNAAHAAQHVQDTLTRSPALLGMMGLALVPVFFSYSGWQTASFMTGELKDPARALPRAMIYGVIGVVALYLAVTVIDLRVLGEGGLAATTTPSSDVARAVFGPLGERLVALLIALSTLGFLSNQVLVSPRVYFQMAEDRTFFPFLAWLHPRTLVPIAAIAVQGVVTLFIVFLGSYDQILNYVTAVDDVFFGLAAVALFVFRARDAGKGVEAGFRMPGHPVTTALFGLTAWAIVLNLFVRSPGDSLIGLGILVAAVPIYYLFKGFLHADRRHRR
ncbi:MAG TPA: amino acid permease [Candidatus Baltobacteraceae bacterium]